MKIKNLFLMLLALPLAFVACDNTDDTPVTPNTPKYDIEMSMAAAVQVPSETNGLKDSEFYIVFGDEAETTMLTITLVNAKGETTIEAGTYTNANGGILLGYSGLKINDTPVAFSEASAIVTLKGDNYAFDITAKTVDGKKCHFTYNGPIYSMGGGNEDDETKISIVNNNFACGFTEGSGNIANNYYVVLANVKINDNMDAANATYCIFDLYSSINSGTVPNGTYTLDSKNSGKAGTAGAEYTYVYTTDSKGKYLSLVEFTEGTVTVSDKKIEAVMTTAEGVTYTMTYEGSLTFDAFSTLTEDLFLDSTTIDIVAAEYEWSDITLKNWTIELYDSYEEKTGLYMVVDIISDATASNYAGTYTASFMGNVNSFFPGGVDEGYVVGSYLTTLLNDKPTETVAPISTGTITIACNADGTETFTFNCEDDMGNKITGSLTGSRVATN